MDAWVDGVVVLVKGEEFSAFVLVSQADKEDKKGDVTLEAEIQEWVNEKFEEMTHADAEKRGFTKLSPEIIDVALEEAQNAVDWPEFE